jgi:hypothetical protein
MNVMRQRYIILLAAVLSVVAVIITALPATGQNMTASPSAAPVPQSEEPYKVWPLPWSGMPAATSPAVPLPTAVPTAR